MRSVRSWNQTIRRDWPTSVRGEASSRAKQVPGSRGIAESVAYGGRLLDLHLKAAKACVCGDVVSTGALPSIAVALAHFDRHEVAHRLVGLVSHGDVRVGVESSKMSSLTSTRPVTGSIQKRPCAGRFPPSPAVITVVGHVSRYSDDPHVGCLLGLLNAEARRGVCRTLELEARLVGEVKKAQRECRRIDTPLDVADVVAGALGQDPLDPPLRRYRLVEE